MASRVYPHRMTAVEDLAMSLLGYAFEPDVAPYSADSMTVAEVDRMAFIWVEARTEENRAEFASLWKKFRRENEAALRRYGVIK